MSSSKMDEVFSTYIVVAP